MPSPSRKAKPSRPGAGSGKGTPRSSKASPKGKAAPAKSAAASAKKPTPAKPSSAKPSIAKKPAASKAASAAAPTSPMPLRPDARRHVLSLAFLRDGDEFMARLETDGGQITELKNRSLDQLLTLVAGELEDLLE